MLTDYHVKYFSHELTKRSSAGSMEKLAASLLDAQVDLNPHQVEAALFAFKSPLSKGALLADEVGLGKTIEAGLVISQKWAERKRNILIVTPSNLRPQWSQELVDKFFLNSLILETKSFNEEIKKGNLNPFAQDKIIICSYNFVKSKEAYIKNIDWNLIVIDEAHRLRNVYKPKNKIANAIKNAVANRPLVLLTATPLQNSLLELFGLVSIIDEHIFGDIKSFKSQFAKLSCDDNFDNLKARLAPICKRTLRRQVLEYIRYTNRKAITQEYIPSEDEQSLYDMVSLYLQRDNLYALPPGQRTLMTLILRKLLASSTFAISGTLEALSKKLESVIVENQFKEIDSESILLENYESYTEIRDEWEGKPDENELTASGDTENDEFEVSDNDEKNESEDENYQYTKEDIEFLKTEVIDLKDFAKHAKSIIKKLQGGSAFNRFAERI